ADAVCCALEPDPAGGLGTLLEFIGKAPVVVFNTGFNKALIERAFEEHLGFTPEWQWLDLQWILPVLFSEKISGQVRLNNWIEAFGLETFQRHHALGDGLMIAQMLIAALGRGSALGAVTARSLIEMERSRRAARR
ncbi:MAG: 3'-5' exonuclease, partial [Rhodocyclaceae bacterium]